MLSSEYKILMKPARIYLIFCPKTHQRIYLSLIKIEKKHCTTFTLPAVCSIELVLRNFHIRFCC